MLGDRMRTSTRLNAMNGMLDVTVYSDEDKGLCTYRLGHGGKSWGWVPVEPDKDNVTFTVPVDMAESIMAALLCHFGITSQPIKPPFDFHAEFMSERERVDKLLDVVVALAG